MANSSEQCPRPECNNEQEDNGAKTQVKALWKKLMLQVHPHFFYDANVNDKNINAWQKKAKEIGNELQEIYQDEEASWQEKLDELNQLEDIITRRDSDAEIRSRFSTNKAESLPANNERNDSKKRSRKALEEELMLLEGDHYNYEGLRMLDEELFPRDMRDADVLETVEKRIEELKKILSKPIVEDAEVNQEQDNEERRFDKEVERRKRNDEEKRFDKEVERRKRNKGAAVNVEAEQGVVAGESIAPKGEDTEKEPAGKKGKKDRISTWSDFDAGLKDIKLKSQLIGYIKSLDGKNIGKAKFDSQSYINQIDKFFNADVSINEIGPESLRNAIKEIRRIELARLGTEFTLGKIGSFEELNAATEKEGDELLKSKARELWNFFATHIKNENKNGNKYSDLDGKCSLELFKAAGVKFDFKEVEYVNPGEVAEGSISVDTGGLHGVRIIREDGWEDTLVIDHHGKMTGNKTSGTQESYEFLISMGLLERTEQLDAVVDFVTKIDNLTYPGIEKYFENSHKTLAGLERFMQFDGLKNFFKTEKNRKNPYRELTEKEMRMLGLINGERNRSVEQKKAADESKLRLEELQRDGLIIESEKYGRVVIDISKRVPGGPLAAKAFGCETYVIWNPEKKSFFISSNEPIEDEFSQGIKIRQRMWIKPRSNSDDLTIELKEVVEKLAGNKFDTEKMKNILEKEEEEKIISTYRKDAQEAVDLYRRDNPAVAEDVLFEKLWIVVEKQMKARGKIVEDKIGAIIDRLKKEVK